MAVSGEHHVPGRFNPGKEDKCVLNKKAGWVPNLVRPFGGKYLLKKNEKLIFTLKF
jgi:hypothetical protein